MRINYNYCTCAMKSVNELCWPAKRIPLRIWLRRIGSVEKSNWFLKASTELAYAAANAESNWFR